MRPLARSTPHFQPIRGRWYVEYGRTGSQRTPAAGWVEESFVAGGGLLRRGGLRLLGARRSQGARRSHASGDGNFPELLRTRSPRGGKVRGIGPISARVYYHRRAFR